MNRCVWHNATPRVVPSSRAYTRVANNEPTKRGDGARTVDIVASIPIAEESALGGKTFIWYLSWKMSASNSSTNGSSKSRQGLYHKVSKRASTWFIAVQVCDICCV
ncbi:hypothetical protein PMIN04_013233 [Paraphaeosphaeria minitans]